MKVKTMTRGTETLADASSTNGDAKQHICTKLVKELGGTYASTLGINLASIESEEIFKWFLASVLFGARIGEGIAIRTYKEFEKTGVLSAEAILKTGWQGLVDILDRGGYVRYDFKTATKLLAVAQVLKEKYEGDLNRLHFFAEDERDLGKKLQGLGKGIGPVTVDIFLREMRGLWEKAEPPLAESALLASVNVGLIETRDVEAGLEQLTSICEVDELHEWRLSDLEAALVRLGKNFCRKKRCLPCPVKAECKIEHRAGLSCCK
jgi:endonuclease III